MLLTEFNVTVACSTFHSAADMVAIHAFCAQCGVSQVTLGVHTHRATLILVLCTCFLKDTAAAVDALVHVCGY